MPDNTSQLRLHTTVLRVRDLERSRKFFAEQVGMKEVYEDIFYKLASFVMGEGARLTLWQLRDGEQPTVTAKDTAYMVFLTQDAVTEREVLEGRGVSVGPIEEYPNGLRMFWFIDPDEHRFVVIQFLPE